MYLHALSDLDKWTINESVIFYQVTKNLPNEKCVLCYVRPKFNEGIINKLQQRNFFPQFVKSNVRAFLVN